MSGLRLRQLCRPMAYLGLTLLCAASFWLLLELAAGRMTDERPPLLAGLGAALLAPEIGFRILDYRHAEWEREQQALRLSEERRRALEAQVNAERDEVSEWVRRFLDEGERGPWPSWTRKARTGAFLPGEECVALCVLAERVETLRSRHQLLRTRASLLPLDWNVEVPVEQRRTPALAEMIERVLDHGSLYATTQRVVFAGSGGTFAVPLAEIEQVLLENDRVLLILKEQVRPVVFHCSERFKAPLLAAAIYRMWREQQRGAVVELSGD